MKLYQAKPQFDPNTGRKAKPKLQEIGVFCDYSGTILLEKDDELSLYTVRFSDQGGSEEYWYYDQHPIIDRLAEALELDDYNIRHALNETEFHFNCADSSGGCNDFSGALVTEWIKNVNVEKHLFFECRDLPTACALARYRTITRLLDQGKIKPEDLGLTR